MGTEGDTTIAVLVMRKKRTSDVAKQRHRECLRRQCCACYPIHVHVSGVAKQNVAYAKI